MEQGTGRLMVVEGDLTWGGERAIQRTDDVSWNGAPETCMTVLIMLPQKVQ